MSPLFWTRWDWAAWQWHHPWTFLIGATVIAAIWAASRKGR